MLYLCRLKAFADFRRSTERSYRKSAAELTERLDFALPTETSAQIITGRRPERFETLTARSALTTDMDDSVVDPAEVEHVADLARVDIDESERERFAEQFGEILGYFETLDAVPEVEAEEELTNVMRPDDVRESLDQSEALENAPDTEDGFFKGPPVS
jgi:aspartyl-tRNA(Asn)/glutamyl-tRNA(Gln) amidotransferase subunit C